ncbi:hypothetical protein [Nitrospina watsonii]|uniref:Uncharacterized protein n=1 Tax=Nitrospina watsonii TaxID=1323948 RepID=A0ABM9HF81_9BACT|nr:hypothetical protein [Nitrospina watsonii]CAI2718881.1 conserved protein of unknown function [Nitrospina watsonii]
MTDTPSSASNSPVQRVTVRRGRRQWRNVPTRMLAVAIRKGKLRRDDEFSLDGTRWSRLDANPQLARLFPEPAAAHVFHPATPPKVEAQLGELARLMRDINQ